VISGAIIGDRFDEARSFWLSSIHHSAAKNVIELRAIMTLERGLNMILKNSLACAFVFSGDFLAQGTINTYAGYDALFGAAASLRRPPN
jgi:hypothetical protein